MSTVRTNTADVVDGIEVETRLLSVAPHATDGRRTSGVLTPGSETVVIIDKRELVRECLALCIGRTSGRKVLSSTSIEEWFKVSQGVESCIVIYCCSEELSAATDAVVLEQLSQLMQRVPVVVMSDRDD